MRRPALAAALLVTLAACGQTAPDRPATALLDLAMVSDPAEGRARERCRTAIESTGFTVMAITEVQPVGGGAGMEMLVEARERGNTIQRRCIVTGSDVVFGEI